MLRLSALLGPRLSAAASQVVGCPLRQSQPVRRDSALPMSARRRIQPLRCRPPLGVCPSRLRPASLRRACLRPPGAGCVRAACCEPETPVSRASLPPKAPPSPPSRPHGQPPVPGQALLSRPRPPVAVAAWGLGRRCPLRWTAAACSSPARVKPA